MLLANSCVCCGRRWGRLGSRLWLLGGRSGTWNRDGCRRGGLGDVCVALGVWLMPHVSVSRLGKPWSDFCLCDCRWKTAPVSSHSTLFMSLGVSLTSHVPSLRAIVACVAGPGQLALLALGPTVPPSRMPVPSPNQDTPVTLSESLHNHMGGCRPSRTSLRGLGWGIGVCGLELEPLTHGEALFRSLHPCLRTCPRRWSLSAPARGCRQGSLLSQVWRSPGPAWNRQMVLTHFGNRLSFQSGRS